MTEATKDKLHKGMAFGSMALLIAIPIISHSVFASKPMVGFLCTVAMTILTSLGLTKVRPLVDLGVGSLDQHKQLAQMLSVIGGGLLVARGMYGTKMPWVGLVIDIVLALFGWAGVVVIKTPGSEEANANKESESANKDGFIDAGLMLVLAATAALFFGVMFSGCAHGTTGLRQACANQMDVAAAGFRAADSWYAAKLAAFKNSTEARDQFVKDDALFNKVRAGIKAESAQANAECAIADTVDAGGKGDVAAATEAVGQSVVNIGQLLMSLQPLLPTVDGGTH